MNLSVTMTDRQKVDVGVTVLDEDGQPITELPPGASVSFTSSDDAVASLELHDDGMNATVRSGKVGSATITVHAEGFATALPDDTLSVGVVNSAPNSLNTTVGTPTDE